MYCSSAQGNMHSSLLTAALYNRLTAGLCHYKNCALKGLVLKNAFVMQLFQCTQIWRAVLGYCLAKNPDGKAD